MSGSYAVICCVLCIELCVHDDVLPEFEILSYAQCFDLLQASNHYCFSASVESRLNAKMSNSSVTVQHRTFKKINASIQYNQGSLDD